MRSAPRARLSGIAIRVIRLLQRASVLVVEAEHVRRAREQLEVFWRQWLLPVRARERVEGVPPVATGVGSATLLESALGVHWTIFDHRDASVAAHSRTGVPIACGHG